MVSLTYPCCPRHLLNPFQTGVMHGAHLIHFLRSELGICAKIKV